MKKKIVFGLVAYSVVFLLSGGYIVYTIESAKKRLDMLITLHQVEILREHYLIQIKRVQADLMLKETSFSRSFDTIVSHVMNMAKVIDTCFDCHHNAEVMVRLDSLKRQTEEYKSAISRVLTIRANEERLDAEETRAFSVGEELMQNVSRMVAMTSAKLQERTAHALGEIEKTKYVLYVLMATVPAVTGIFILVLLRSLTHPMHLLLLATRRLKGGELDFRVERLEDEFGELAVSFNEMAGALKEHMEKMQRTEQMVVAAELAAGLAHEIKNPLAGIKVAMNVLSDEANLSPEDKDVLGKVVAEVGRLETLMKNFLNFTKPPKPQPETIHVHHLLNTTLAFSIKNQALPARGSGGIEIVKDFQPVPPTEADPMQLQQVFLNIVLNAIQAMPGGGTLEIRTTPEPDGRFIRIAISDTGKGIAPEILGKIFQPFFTTKPKGTGLGLAISRQLIEQQGGTIDAESRSGGGTTFVIRLPVAPGERTVGA